jgi:thiol-disulfide isomerase/thioredoxin
MQQRWFAILLVGLMAPAVPARAENASPSGKTPVAPHFKLPTDRGTVDSDSLRGHVVLVDFWASWCGPCEQSFPWLRAMDARFAGKGLRIVAINLDKKHEAAEGFLQRHVAPFTVAFDPLGKTAEAFQVPGMPTSFLIDPEGKILYSHVGFDPKKTGDLEALIAKECP